MSEIPQQIPNKKKIEITRNVNEYTHRQKATAKLKKSGIIFPTQPSLPEKYRNEDGTFRMPQDVSNLTYHELGELLSILQAMLQWYGAVLAGARVDKLTAERVMNYAQAQIRMSILEDEAMAKRYKAREDKEAFIYMDENVKKAQDWYDEQASLVELMEQLYTDFDRSFRTVSREISRRGGEFHNERRENNLQ